jgi:DNA-binding response OmpR family regulator
MAFSRVSELRDYSAMDGCRCQLLLISGVPSTRTTTRLLRGARAAVAHHTPVVFLARKDVERPSDMSNVLAVLSPSFAGLYGLVRLALRSHGLNFSAPVLAWGPYRFASVIGSVHVAGVEVRLGPADFDFALELFSNAGAVLSYERLSSIFRQRGDGTAGKLDARVSRLRQRLFLQGLTGWLLESVANVGCRLVAPAGTGVTPNLCGDLPKV